VDRLPLWFFYVLAFARVWLPVLEWLVKCVQVTLNRCSGVCCCVLFQFPWVNDGCENNSAEAAVVFVVIAFLQLDFMHDRRRHSVIVLPEKWCRHHRQLRCLYNRACKLLCCMWFALLQC